MFLGIELSNVELLLKFQQKRNKQFHEGDALHLDELFPNHDQQIKLSIVMKFIANEFQKRVQLLYVENDSINNHFEVEFKLTGVETTVLSFSFSFFNFILRWFEKCFV